MRYTALIICCIACTLFPDWVFSQEKLVSVGSYPTLEASSLQIRVKTGVPDVLELPFIEDFSGSSLYPSSDHWSDFDALINNSLCLNQPTMGVATLDAMDSTGQIYPEAEIVSFLADKLTSLPINLFLPQDTTVYLSFYYQAGGLGDMPEPSDSLILEFYAPDTDSWTRVWSHAGTPDPEIFHYQLVHVTDSRFLQSGFRFRFRNYASLANSYEPSLKVNADHWHIDYVYLNKNRNYLDTVMQDVALIEAPGSLLLNYTAIPWQHFREVGISAVRTLFPVHLRNLANSRFFYTPEFSIEDSWGGTSGYSISLPTDEIKSFEEQDYDAAFNYGFSSDAADSALFRVTLALNPDPSDWIPANNSIEVEQEFTNYYAYDDGFPEAGYGLVGEGSRNARVAYRFQNYYPGDSLVGVKFYFNQSFNQSNRKYFQLAIWNEINNQPGDLIYLQEGIAPKFEYGLNGFQLIELDTAQLAPSVYYIGWIQVTNDFLNVGFDKNYDHSADIFYRLSGDWHTSSFAGSLMLRPVFGNKSKKTGMEDYTYPNPIHSMVLYPNPVNNLLTFELPEETGEVQLFIIDMSGRMVMNEETDQRQIHIASLPNGTYFFQCLTNAGQIYRTKFLVLHD